MTQQTGPMLVASGALGLKVEAWKSKNNQASHIKNLDVGGKRAVSRTLAGLPVKEVGGLAAFSHRVC